MASRPTTRILVGTADGLHTLGGRTAPQLAGHEIRNLSRDAHGWWCIVDQRHLYSRATGSRWKRSQDVRSIDADDRLALVSLLPGEGGVWIGASKAQLLKGGGNGIAHVESFASHSDRPNWYTPWGGPPVTRSLARGADGAIYVNVHVGGVLRSRDEGRTWKQTMDIGADAHQITAHPEQAKLLFAATARGLAVSRDAGANWTFETDGLHANYARAVAVTRDRVLVSSSHGPDGRQAALYWRPLKGRRPLVQCRTGLPHWFDENIDTFTLDAVDTLAAFGTPDGRVFVSEDQGDSWQQIGDGLPAVRCLRILPAR